MVEAKHAFTGLVYYLSLSYRLNMSGNFIQKRTQTKHIYQHSIEAINTFFPRLFISLPKSRYFCIFGNICYPSMLICNSTFATKLVKKMDARLKLGLAFWFTVMSCMAVRPPYHLHHALPNATDNDSTQADKARNTLPRVVNLKEVNVLAPRQLTQPTVAQALNEQRLIAGSTSLVQMSSLRQRLSTLKDALAMQPGVIIQEFFGLNDQPRLNIRGSGIQSNPQRRGVYLLQDGIPVNFADGSYIIGVMDPMTAHFR